jgi:hypothetical protein
VLTDTISLELDAHLRFRAAPVWLSTAIAPSEPCAVSPLAARIISSLVPMPRSALYTLIESTRLNGVNPQLYLADVLAPIPGQAH